MYTPTETYLTLSYREVLIRLALRTTTGACVIAENADPAKVYPNVISERFERLVTLNIVRLAEVQVGDSNIAGTFYLAGRTLPVYLPWRNVRSVQPHGSRDLFSFGSFSTDPAGPPSGKPHLVLHYGGIPASRGGQDTEHLPYAS